MVIDGPSFDVTLVGTRTSGERREHGGRGRERETDRMSWRTGSSTKQVQYQKHGTKNMKLYGRYGIMQEARTAKGEVYCNSMAMGLKNLFFLNRNSFFQTSF